VRPLYLSGDERARRRLDVDDRISTFTRPKPGLTFSFFSIFFFVFVIRVVNTRRHYGFQLHTTLAAGAR